MLTRNIVKALPIPHEPGNELTVRMLSWIQAKDARDARSSAALKAARELGPDLLKDIQSVRTDPAPVARVAVKDPLDDYDQATILRCGVVGWSGPGYTEPCTPENVAELDPVTAEWAAREIIALTLSARTEEERGNASAPSTAL